MERNFQMPSCNHNMCKHQLSTLTILYRHLEKTHCHSASTVKWIAQRICQANRKILFLISKLSNHCGRANKPQFTTEQQKRQKDEKQKILIHVNTLDTHYWSSLLCPLNYTLKLTRVPRLNESFYVDSVDFINIMSL